MISIGVNFKSSNTRKGLIAERKVTTLLRSKGFIARQLRLQGSDVKVINPITGEIILLEVKYSSVNSDGKYRACADVVNKTNCHKSDYVIFIVHPKGVGGRCTTYVIPSHLITSKNLTITSNPDYYNGKYAAFKEAWYQLESE